MQQDTSRRRRLVSRLAAVKAVPPGVAALLPDPVVGSPLSSDRVADDEDVRPLVPPAAIDPFADAPAAGLPLTDHGDEAAEEDDEDVRALRPVPAPTAAPVAAPAAPVPAAGWSAAAVNANPGPLPDPLPPPLDAAVRALREDLLVTGGAAAGLADELCARHRDRLREAFGLDSLRPR